MSLRIPHGDVSRAVPFKAVDSVDLVTPETGLDTFTVYYAIDGGTDVQVTTPTTTEMDATNMPGLYWLDIDEAAMVALPAGAVECQVSIHITKTGMAPVSAVYTVFAGNLAGTVASGTPSATAFIVDLPSSDNDVYND